MIYTKYNTAGQPEKLLPLFQRVKIRLNSLLEAITQVFRNAFKGVEKEPVRKVSISKVEKRKEEMQETILDLLTAKPQYPKYQWAEELKERLDIILKSLEAYNKDMNPEERVSEVVLLSLRKLPWRDITHEEVCKNADFLLNSYRR